MRWISAILVALAMTAALAHAKIIFGLAHANEPDVAQMQREMMQTVVRVETPSGSGSGTIIFSRAVDHVGIVTLVLTNNHVIADDGDDGDVVKDVSVDQYVYDKHGVQIETVVKRAKVISHDEDSDLAVLQLADDVNVMPVAYIEPETDALNVFDQVFAIGSGLGRPTFPTAGMISDTDVEMNGHRFIMESAPIIFGNSGGALFKYSETRKHYELVGVPSEVPTYGKGHAVASHMGIAIPMAEVRQFLHQNGGDGIIQ
jgi:S1-C subfamily serine protease